MFTVKYLPNGIVERYKAPLVVKGSTQTYGVEYAEIFSPVAKIESVHILISLTTNLGRNVKNTFLHGDLGEEMYMEQPPEFITRRE